MDLKKELELDLTSALNAVKELNSEINKIELARPKLQVDTSAAKRSLDEYNRRVRESSRNKLEIEATVDDSELNELERDVSALNGAGIDLEAAVNDSAIDELQSQVARLSGETLDILVDVADADLDSFEGALSNLDNFVLDVRAALDDGDIDAAEAKLSQLDGFVIDIDATLEDSDIDTVAAQLSQLDGFIVDIAASVADADVDTLETQLSRLNGSTVDVGVSVEDFQLSELQTAVTRLSGETIDILATVDDGELAGFETQLTAIDNFVLDIRTAIDAGDIDTAQTQLQQLDGFVIDVDLTVDGSALDTVDSKLRQLDGFIADIKASVDAGDVDTLQSQLSSLDGSIVDVSLEVDADPSVTGAALGAKLGAGITDKLGSVLPGGLSTAISGAGAAAGPLTAIAALGASIALGISSGVERDLERQLKAIFSGVSPDVTTELNATIKEAIFGGAIDRPAASAFVSELSRVIGDEISSQNLIDLNIVSQQVGVDAQELGATAARALRTGITEDIETFTDTVGASIAAVGPKATQGILESLEEFAPNLEELGVSFEEYVGIATRAFDQGLLPSIESAAELLQEFGNKLQTGDAEESLSRLGIEIDEVQTLLADGRGEEALDRIVTELLEVEDAAIRDQLAVEIFGSKLEDAASPTAVAQLIKTREEFALIGDEVDLAADAIEGSLITALTGLKTTASETLGDLSDVLGSAFLDDGTLAAESEQLGESLGSLIKDGLIVGFDVIQALEKLRQQFVSPTFALSVADGLFGTLDEKFAIVAIDAANALVTSLASGISGGLGLILEPIDILLNGIIEQVNKFPGVDIEPVNFSDVSLEVEAFGQDLRARMLEQIGVVAEDTSEAARTDYNAALEKGFVVNPEVASRIGTNASDALVSPLISEIDEQLRDKSGEIPDGFADTLIEGIKEKQPDISEVMLESLGEVPIEELIGFYEDEVPTIADGFGEALAEGFQDQKDSIEESLLEATTLDGVIETFEEGLEGLQEALDAQELKYDVIDQLEQAGFDDVANFAQDAGAELINELNDALASGDLDKIADLERQFDELRDQEFNIDVRVEQAELRSFVREIEGNPTILQTKYDVPTFPNLDVPDVEVQVDADTTLAEEKIRTLTAGQQTAIVEFLADTSAVDALPDFPNLDVDVEFNPDTGRVDEAIRTLSEVQISALVDFLADTSAVDALPDFPNLDVDVEFNPDTGRVDEAIRTLSEVQIDALVDFLADTSAVDALPDFPNLDVDVDYTPNTAAVDEANRVLSETQITALVEFLADTSAIDALPDFPPEEIPVTFNVDSSAYDEFVGRVFDTTLTPPDIEPIVNPADYNNFVATVTETGIATPDIESNVNAANYEAFVDRVFQAGITTPDIESIVNPADYNNFVATVENTVPVTPDIQSSVDTSLYNNFIQQVQTFTPTQTVDIAYFDPGLNLPDRTQTVNIVYNDPGGGFQFDGGLVNNQGVEYMAAGGIAKATPGGVPIMVNGSKFIMAENGGDELFINSRSSFGRKIGLINKYDNGRLAKDLEGHYFGKFASRLRGAIAPAPTAPVPSVSTSDQSTTSTVTNHHWNVTTPIQDPKLAARDIARQMVAKEREAKARG